MAKRLRDVCGLPESEPLWRAGRGFVVRDLPGKSFTTKSPRHKEKPETWCLRALVVGRIVLQAQPQSHRRPDRAGNPSDKCQVF
jgi:hypothetical protein